VAVAVVVCVESGFFKGVVDFAFIFFGDVKNEWSEAGIAVFAPRIAIIMPLLVSPIFMVEVSTAAMVVSWWLGFRAMGWRLSCSFEGCCSKVRNC
jgi:hypothetical protein